MNSYLSIVLPLLADGPALLLVFWLVTPLSARLAEPAGLNSLLLVSVYVLFLVGVFLLRKLAPGPAGARFPLVLGQKTRGVLALLFGLVMMTAVSYQLGYFNVFMQTGPIELDEGGSAAFFVFGPSAWLFLAMFYIFVLAFPSSPRIATASRWYLPLAFLALLASNGLLVLAVGQLHALVRQFSLSGVLWFLPLLLLLALLFLPPRLLYAQRQGGWFSMATFALLILLCALVVTL